MEFNISRVRASELYLAIQWSKHTSPPQERRSTIFQEFVKLGMRNRWEWHKKAETYTFSDEEKEILECRTERTRAISFWMSANDRSEIVVMTKDANKLEKDEDEPEYRIKGEAGWLYCEYDEEGGPFGMVPEIAYSLTMFDDPDDVEEARGRSTMEAREKTLEGGYFEPDQSLWVSGVYVNEDMIVWVDEFGETIRQKVIDMNQLEEDFGLFESYKPFETSWWIEAEKVGKYAGDQWWR